MKHFRQNDEIKNYDEPIEKEAFKNMEVGVGVQA